MFRSRQDSYNFFIYFQFESSNLGQRYELSEKDIMKINNMYSDQCNDDIVNITQLHYEHIHTQSQSSFTDPYTASINFLASLFSLKWVEKFVAYVAL